MKKSTNLALKASAMVPVSKPQVKELPGALKTHEHIHAANCGHKSYVHGDHIDYEHDGHFHYMLDGRTYDCPGPNAKVIPFPKGKVQSKK